MAPTTRLSVPALTVAALLVLTGCAGTTKEADPTKSALTQGSNRPSATASAVASSSTVPSETPTPTPTPEDGPRKFGARFTYEDGLTVIVAKPVPFQPSEYSAAEEAPAYLSFKMTIINGTGKRYDPSLFQVSVQSNDTEAGEVYDSANGFEGAPSTTVLPGRESSFKVGFGVANPKDLVVQATPGFEYDDAIFTN